MVVIFVNYKFFKLWELFRIIFYELDDKDKELFDIEMKIEIFFIKEKNNVIEKSCILKENLVDFIGKFLVEFY